MSGHDLLGRRNGGRRTPVGDGAPLFAAEHPSGGDPVDDELSANAIETVEIERPDSDVVDGVAGDTGAAKLAADNSAELVGEMMTALIFATATAASPMIHIDADPDVVLRHLAQPSMAWGTPMSPSLAAILFLRGLSPERFNDWAPSIESVPVMSIADADDGLWADIVWNTETWAEVLAPDLPEFHDPDPAGGDAP